MWDFIKPENITALVLVLFRVGGVFLTSPLFSNKAVPNRVKLGIVIGTSCLLFPNIKHDGLGPLGDHVTLALWIAQEVTIGVIIGFAASFVFATVQSAGELFGMQVGFSIATIFDPANEGSAGVITSFYVIIGALIFLYLDGHHIILQSVARSFELLPLGKGFNINVGWILNAQIVKLFALAIQMSAPLLVVMTLLSIIFGLITKLSPQMNIYMNMGFVLGPIVGMGTLMLSLPLFRVLLTKMTGEMGHEIEEVLKQLRGV